MTIGEKIRELRREENITQEQLAEYLNISCQAVSKWENNVTLPDITLVVPLANFFGVTPDTLFDFDREREEAELKEYEERAQRLNNQGKMRELIALWREACAKYPKDFNCLGKLLNGLFLYACGSSQSDEEKLLREEITDIGERILRDCSDDNIRASARQILVYNYSCLGNEEKAIETALTAQSLYVSREMLMHGAYCSAEDRRRSTQSLVYTLLDSITSSILNNTYKSDDDYIFALESLLKIWELLIPDGNYLFIHCRISDIHLYLSRLYAGRGDRESTLEHLRLAKFHSSAFDNMPEGEQHYTGVFFDACTCDKSGFSKNYDCSNTENLLRRLSDKCYDFLRGDPGFERLKASEA